MCVIGIAWYHMPVQMRHHVAKAGKIDFLGLHHLAHDMLDLPEHIHQEHAIELVEISDFFYVVAPDDATKPRIVFISHQHDTKLCALMQHLATRRFAQFAVW